ncbi:MAG: exodeoxyribonuclease VII large subunit [Betaproteobacteria bacterium]
MKESYSSNVPLASSAPVIAVSMLNRLAREKLESAFPLCWVSGEISNLTYATSGHVYFSLKDAAAQVRCVMFRNRAQLLGWRLENGQHIEARVLVTLYEARGDFQLNVEAARKAGQGNLYERFLQLKNQLESEGLFSSESKRSLPVFPRCIGLITSPQAAALRDILTTLRRRAPHVKIVIYPTPVQGEGAAGQIASAIRSAGQRQECDVFILSRGGGSLEDLWAFNDENLARTIRACPIPIITGIGHETDFTIADFVADQRAPTPTAAAELAAPEHSALSAALAEHRRALRRRIRQNLEQRNQHLDTLALRLLHPAQTLARQREHLLNLQRRLDSSLRQNCTRGRNLLSSLSHRLLLARPDTTRHARRLEALAPKLRSEWHRNLNAKASDLTRLAASLTHLNPEAVLSRGYSIVTDPAGAILRDSRSLEPNDRIAVRFHSGHVEATVNSTSQGA